MEYFAFLIGALVIIAIVLIRSRAQGSGSDPDRIDGGTRPTGEIDLARMSSGRSVQGGPGENRMGAGRGIAGLGGNSSKSGPPDGLGD